MLATATRAVNCYPKYCSLATLLPNATMEWSGESRRNRNGKSAANGRLWRAEGMAKKKTGKAAVSQDERVAVVVLKGTPEYREWLTGISRKSLIPAASIVRDAL